MLVLACIITLVLFSTPETDLRLIEYFYSPRQIPHWPLANAPVWSVLYKSTPWVTAGLVIAGSGLIISGITRAGSRQQLRHGLFIILSLAVGPGLIVNSALKEHWGRARPREITQFGGVAHYTVPFQPSSAGGNHFPAAIVLSDFSMRVVGGFGENAAQPSPSVPSSSGC